MNNKLPLSIRTTIIGTLLISALPATEAADRPEPLKLAVIAPVLDWDNVPEIKRLTDFVPWVLM